MGTKIITRCKGVPQDTHFHLLQRLRMSTAKPLLPLYSFRIGRGTTLLFITYIINKMNSSSHNYSALATLPNKRSILKRKSVPITGPVVAQRVGRGIAQLFHDRGTRRGRVVSSTPWPYFTRGKDPVPIVQKAGWVPGPVWTGRKSRPTGIRSPDRPAHSRSLYRLMYRPKKEAYYWLINNKQIHTSNLVAKRISTRVAETEMAARQNQCVSDITHAYHTFWPIVFCIIISCSL